MRCERMCIDIVTQAGVVGVLGILVYCVQQIWIFLHQKHQVVSTSFWPECAHCILMYLLITQPYKF